MIPYILGRKIYQLTKEQFEICYDLAKVSTAKSVQALSDSSSLCDEPPQVIAVGVLTICGLVGSVSQLMCRIHLEADTPTNRYRNAIAVIDKIRQAVADDAEQRGAKL